MAVKIKQIKPGVDIFARRAELFHFVREISDRLGIAVGCATQMIVAPRGDFPRLALLFRVGMNPRKQFVIAAAFGDFGFQRLVVETGEVEEMRVHAFAAVMIFAQFAGERRAALRMRGNKT